MQEPVTLLEYSLNAVTEGIDAIATTRVVIRGDCSHTSKHALTGQEVQRTFRYVLLSRFYGLFSGIMTPVNVLFCTSGTGASMDVVVSSVKGYISALNKMFSLSEKRIY